MEDRHLRGLVACVASLTALLAACDPPSATGPASQPAPARQVRIAAAADLRYALDELVGAFRRNHPDIAVAVTYGSSGNFYTQLCNDAPFDLFLSADLAYAQKLAEQGKGMKDS